MFCLKVRICPPIISMCDWENDWIGCYVRNFGILLPGLWFLRNFSKCASYVWWWSATRFILYRYFTSRSGFYFWSVFHGKLETESITSGSPIRRFSSSISLEKVLFDNCSVESIFWKHFLQIILSIVWYISISFCIFCSDGSDVLILFITRFIKM